MPKQTDFERWKKRYCLLNLILDEMAFLTCDLEAAYQAGKRAGRKQAYDSRLTTNQANLLRKAME